MKKYLLTFLILITATLNTAYGEITRTIEANELLVEPTSGIVRVNKDKTANDTNQKLYAIVGKSQLLKFDEPITRLSITDPQYADLVILNPNELLLNGKKAGRTSLIFWGKHNNPIFYNLVIQPDIDAFVEEVEKAAPNDNFNLGFTEDGVILSGKVSSTGVKDQIKEIAKAYKLNIVDIAESPTKQVLLQVKIADASRSFTRNIGSTFAAGDTYKDFVTNVIGSTASKISNIAFDGTLNGLKYVFVNDSSKLAWQLNLAEQEGIFKVLAEPKLLAIDKTPGSFNVGNQVPIPSSVGQYGQVSYSFKNTGVILNFTPTILEKSNRVILKLSPEVSEIDNSVAIMQPGGGMIPGFKTRSVDTTVELADGETLIIAGLLKHTTSRSKTKIPWISDIPYLGWLFSNTTDKKDDNELIIFITPKIIDPDSNIDRI